MRAPPRQAVRRTCSPMVAVAIAALLSMTWFSTSAAQPPPAVSCSAGQVQPGLSGQISAGATLIRASADQNKVTAGVNATYYPGSSRCTVPTWRTLLSVNADYGDKSADDGPTIVIRNYRADLQQMRMFGGGKTFFAATARWRHSNTQGIDLQQFYTATAGVRLTSLSGLELSAGPGWSRLDLTDETDSSFFGAFLGETGSIGLPLGLTTILHHGLKAFFPFESDESHRIEALAGVTFQLTSRLSLSWNVWYDYFEDPPPDSESDYLNTTFAIGLGF